MIAQLECFGSKCMYVLLKYLVADFEKLIDLSHLVF